MLVFAPCALVQPAREKRGRTSNTHTVSVPSRAPWHWGPSRSPQRTVSSAPDSPTARCCTVGRTALGAEQNSITQSFRRAGGLGEFLAQGSIPRQITPGLSDIEKLLRTLKLAGLRCPSLPMLAAAAWKLCDQSVTKER